MAYVTMVRITDFPGRDNYIAPQAPNFQYYEQTLTATGTSNWILIPNDGIPVQVMMSFSGTATAHVDVTDSPGSLITGVYTGTPLTVQGIASGSSAAKAQHHLDGNTIVRNKNPVARARSS